LAKFQIFTILGAVFPHFCPYEHEIWHGDLTSLLPCAKFHVYQGNVSPMWSKNTFLDQYQHAHCVQACQWQLQLEVHSVECMYLRQRCSDGSQWIKPF